MDYQVIARKYRPQVFAEVVGQEAISRTLGNAIRRNRLAHGFVFGGPSGVGKTTMARILAKALVCEHGPTAEPCGICQHCRMVADSTHPDVQEQDAALHTRVEEMRQLCESIQFSPTLARSKIYIFDEAHMLSSSSWNALLKILEEPPAFVRFIFATTEVEAIPATVLNRCQRYDFRAIGGNEIVVRLRDIARREGAELSDGVLRHLARAAGGGMREAQTLLDQLMAMAEGPVSEDDLHLLLGSARTQDLLELARLLIVGERVAALAALDRLLGSGVAAIGLLHQLIDHFRQLMLLSFCGAEHPAVTRLGPVVDGQAAQATQAGPEKSLRICQLLLGAEAGIRHGIEGRLQLEMTCVRIASLGELQDLDSLLRRIERVERSGAGGPPPGR